MNNLSSDRAFITSVIYNIIDGTFIDIFYAFVRKKKNYNHLRWKYVIVIVVCIEIIVNLNN